MIDYRMQRRLTYIGGGIQAQMSAWPGGINTTGLISWWTLDETSGTRNDSHGTNHLTDVNTVLYGTGKKGNAADFEVGAIEHLYIADNASLSTGDIDFTFAAWVWFESAPGVGAGRSVAGKYDVDVGIKREWALLWEKTSGYDALFFVVSNNGTAVASAAYGSTPSAGVWYFIVCWHDATANTINIQLDNGTVYSTSHTTGAFDSGARFALGTVFSGNAALGNYSMDGLIDEASFWKRVLTADERTWLFNGGAGRTYSDL